MNLIYGLWRHSDNRLIRVYSLFLCLLGFHLWVCDGYTGYKINCGVCNKKG